VGRPSFFLTGVDVRGGGGAEKAAAAGEEEEAEEGRAEETEAEAFARLALELSRYHVDHSIDMPTGELPIYLCVYVYVYIYLYICMYVYI